MHRTRNILIVNLILLLISPISYAQKEGNIWYFGNNAGLDFNTNPPTVLSNGAMHAPEGSSSISDATGNFLFYTDGASIWNRNHQMFLHPMEMAKMIISR